mmetsp:Transcript_21554/g.48982  ORF Transcript_21554/g.48982 Transcript_21554/m.48982 type:complete len:307 (+) Transcript_21554:503-1423(+)
MAPRAMAFHASSPSKKDEEEYVAPTISLRVKPRTEESIAALQAETLANTSPSKGGLFGTGYNELYAYPLGIILGIPIICNDWFVLSAETQLLACFMTFSVAVWSQGGDAIRKTLEERAKAIIDEHGRLEGLNIEAMKELIDTHKKRVSMVEDVSALNDLRSELIEKISAARSMQLQYESNEDIERKLNMLVLAEANAEERAKTELVAEAKASVTEQMTESKSSKKAALDLAIDTIKGADSKKDPVKDLFSKFFTEKIATAKAGSGKTVKLSNADHADIMAEMAAFAKKEGLEEIEISYPKEVPMYK